MSRGNDDGRSRLFLGKYQHHDSSTSSRRSAIPKSQKLWSPAGSAGFPVTQTVPFVEDNSELPVTLLRHDVDLAFRNFRIMDRVDTVHASVLRAVAILACDDVTPIVFLTTTSRGAITTLATRYVLVKGLEGQSTGS